MLAPSSNDGYQGLDDEPGDDASDLSSTDDSSSDSSDHHIPGPIWQNKKSKVAH